MSLIFDMAKLNGSTFFEEEDWDSFSAIANLTGFNAIDIFSGSIEYDIYGVPRLNGGLFARPITIVGQSATGKTSLAIKVIAASVDRWNRMYGAELSEMVMDDSEDNSTIHRIQGLTGWSDWEFMSRCRYYNKVMSINDIYNQVREIADLKEKNRKALTVDTGIMDIDGYTIKVLSPTYLLVDSIAALSGDGATDLEFDKDGKLKESEKMVGNVDAMTEARGNTAFIKKVKAYLSKYNIVLIMINHIIEKPQMGMFDFPTRVLPFLKPGERLKGGNELVYQSFAIWNLNYKTKIDDKDPIYGDRIRGAVTHLIFVKSKSNVEGLPVPMVFDQRTGHRPELSDWEYIYNASYGIGGSPARYFLKILPEITFTRKGLYDACLDNPLLARALSFTARCKMVTDVIVTDHDRRAVAPDMQALTDNMSYENRVALILTFTDIYPGYDHSKNQLDANTMEIALNHQKYIMANDSHVEENRSYIFSESLYLDLLDIPGEGEVKCIPFSNVLATPFDERILGVDGEPNYIFTSEEV